MYKRYTRLHYIGLILLTLLGSLYAAPNLFGEDPAIQIATTPERQTAALPAKQKIHQWLTAEQLTYKAIETQKQGLLIRFQAEDTQLKARDVLRQHLPEQVTIALNLASRTPAWLQKLGANPMKLGLDLRGGVHFLLEVDIDSLLKARTDGDLRAIGQHLRTTELPYTALLRHAKHPGIIVRAATNTQRQALQKSLNQAFPDYTFVLTKQGKQPAQVEGTLSPQVRQKVTDYAIEQNTAILRQRVNELGVAEAQVQRQGLHHISVDLPGIQDTARAKNLLGKTATLAFHLVDTEHNVADALAGQIPFGTLLMTTQEGRPVLLKSNTILKGNSITYASAVFRDSGPGVNIRLGGGGESTFHRITSEHVGEPLAVVYVEVDSKKKRVNGHLTTVRTRHEKIISIATIQSALGNNFDITGLHDTTYAENLALLLRSGALAAPVAVVQELTVGPSLGQHNIDLGIRSLVIGSLLVIIFMLLYYRLFGLIANFAILLNIVFLVALLSLLDATLTLPGIAAIVLTVGMAVDANVLINERIREELRLGRPALASIHAGYEHAFSTIVDSNVTTLIVAVILFSLGSGSVKGFAVSLMVGLLCSMLTSIVFTRACVQLIYRDPNRKTLSIGI